MDLKSHFQLCCVLLCGSWYFFFYFVEEVEDWTELQRLRMKLSFRAKVKNIIRCLHSLYKHCVHVCQINKWRSLQDVNHLINALVTLYWSKWFCLFQVLVHKLIIIRGVMVSKTIRIKNEIFAYLKNFNEEWMEWEHFGIIMASVLPVDW